MSERYFKVLRERQHLNTRNYYYIRNLITLSRKQTSKAETSLMNRRSGRKARCSDHLTSAGLTLLPTGPGLQNSRAKEGLSDESRGKQGGCFPVWLFVSRKKCFALNELLLISLSIFRNVNLSIKNVKANTGGSSFLPLPAFPVIELTFFYFSHQHLK